MYNKNGTIILTRKDTFLLTELAIELSVAIIIHYLKSLNNRSCF